MKKNVKFQFMRPDKNKISNIRFSSIYHNKTMATENLVQLIQHLDIKIDELIRNSHLLLVKYRLHHHSY